MTLPTQPASAAVQRPVLIVEDDHDVRVSVRSTLEEEGFQVVSAANGAQALDLIKQLEPGLIILDLRMPLMDGWEFVGELLNASAGKLPPIVVYTAYHDVTPPPGIIAFLKKPVDAKALVAFARQHCV